MTDYLFDQTWMQEKRRLDALGRLYDEGTVHCLMNIGIGQGWHCLEVGAGSGTIAEWMATIVGESGRVVASDSDPRFLTSLDRRIEVSRLDVTVDAIEPGAFDLIHARAVLQHVPDRDIALRRLVAALKPGGTLVVEDIVEPHGVCYPEMPAWTKMLAAINEGLKRSGADPSYGIKLHRKLQEAGLLEVRSAARVPLVQSGTPSIEFIALSVEHLADKLVAAGIVTADDVSCALADFRTPGRTMTAATMIAAWGARPT